MALSISIWGDSIMRGVIFDSERRKYTLLRDSAAELFSKCFSIPIRNHSRFGCTALRACETMTRTILTDPVSDLVLLEFGGNDCDYDWKAVSRDPSRKHLPNTTVDHFEDAFRKMIHAIRTAGGRPVTMTLPPINADRYFDFITSDSEVEPSRVLEFLGDKQLIYRKQELYSNLVSRIALESGIPVVDVRTAFLEKDHLHDFLCLDGIHPNGTGQKLIKEVFAKRFRSLEK